MPATGKKIATEDYVNDKVRALEKQIEGLKVRIAASVAASGEDGAVDYVQDITVDGTGHVTDQTNKSMIFTKGLFKETG